MSDRCLSAWVDVICVKMSESVDTDPAMVTGAKNTRLTDNPPQLPQNYGAQQTRLYWTAMLQTGLMPSQPPHPLNNEEAGKPRRVAKNWTKPVGFLFKFKEFPSYLFLCFS
ncbi:RAB3B protein, partial [Atractosteus spatula]|nr:RAB3B protein [Atractosteus spatula]